VTIPTSGTLIAYTGDVNVIYSVDTTPALPTGTTATAPIAQLADTATGTAHPEMVPGCVMGTGNTVLLTLTGLAKGYYSLVVEVYPTPPGATGERITCAPLSVQVPS
jgi:hypothetical protein